MHIRLAFSKFFLFGVKQKMAYIRCSIYYFKNETITTHCPFIQCPSKVARKCPWLTINVTSHAWRYVIVSSVDSILLVFLHSIFRINVGESWKQCQIKMARDRWSETLTFDFFCEFRYIYSFLSLKCYLFW